jgi:hypothetical protein
MKLVDILELNANRSMDIELVNGTTVTAGSWTVKDELIGAHKQKGYTIYICLDKIVSIKVESAL